MGKSTKKTVPNRTKKTILLVEDDTNLLKLLRAVLEQAGYDVLQATDPEHALWICEQYTGQIHLLVSDVVMPGKNGTDLSETVNRRWPEVKIVLVSGHPDAPKLIANSLSGIPSPICFVPKPISRERLLTAIRSLVS
jgi:two-component system, cell cycle sensor histidine kinase and response regulator CckA